MMQLLSEIASRRGNGLSSVLFVFMQFTVSIFVVWLFPFEYISQ